MLVMLDLKEAGWGWGASKKIHLLHSLLLYRLREKIIKKKELLNFLEKPYCVAAILDFILPFI